MTQSVFERLTAHRELMYKLNNREKQFLKHDVSRELKTIYEEIEGKKICGSCNKSWIYRLGALYVQAENSMAKKVKTNKKK